MRKVTLLLLLSSFMLADVVEIKNFESDLFSKDRNRVKKIEFSLLFDGRDLKENRYKIVDALNIVISSFYVEDLFTSKGKERFKTVIIKYISKKYAVDIDDIFIQQFKVKENVSVDAFIDALRDEGFCRENPRKLRRSIAESFEDIEIDN
ncbi:MAG TPA: flagellar basal body-associated FliL family protein [Campylobacterales bacterium]|nr:flagellar basal body-associated FliL family protein [Campylobacterales bacterium]